MPVQALTLTALGAALVALAALLVAVVALLVGWRTVRALDRIVARLAGPVAPPAAAPPAGDEEAELPASGELRLLVESMTGRGPVLVLRNDGPAPADDLMVAIDGWFTGAMGGPYENDPPPSRLAPGASWRCPIAEPPRAGAALHVLLRWSRDGMLERREVELPC